MKLLAVFAVLTATVSTLRAGHQSRDEEHEFLFACKRHGGEKCGTILGFRSCCQPGRCEGTFPKHCPDQYQLDD